MTTMAASLSVPAIDDTMEISSDAGRADQDIDIDYMGEEHHEDEDWMLQDAASDRGNQQADAHDDDLMYDEETYVDEETMQDDVPFEGNATQDVDFGLDAQVPASETLYDFSEPTATLDVDQQFVDDFNQPEEETLHEVYEQTTDHEHAAEVAVDAPLSFEDASHLADPSLAETVGELKQETYKQVEPTWTEGVTGAAVTEQLTETYRTATGDASTALDLQEPFVEATPAMNTSASEAVSRHDSPAPDDESKDTIPASETSKAPQEVSESFDTEPRSPFAFTSMASHPVTLFYTAPGKDTRDAVQYSLFACSAQDDPSTYLLRDSSVAASSLTDLFRACRSVLDGGLNDEHELKLYIYQLDLTIREDSVICNDSSLAQIIDVYIQLVQNESDEPAQTLEVQLSTKKRKRMTAYLSSIFHAASQGKGLHSLDCWADENQQVEQDSDQSQEEEQEQEIPETQQEEDPIVEAEGQEHTEVPVADETISSVALAPTEEDSAEKTEAAWGWDGVDVLQPDEDPTTQDNFYDDATAYEEEQDEEQVGQAEATFDDADAQDQHATEEVEQGDGESSGSSTVQGEGKAESTKLENDASSQTAQPRDEPTKEDSEQLDTDASHSAFTNDAFGDTFDLGNEIYDENAFSTDNFNQGFDENQEYTEDFGHEEYQEAEQNEPEAYDMNEQPYHDDVQALTQGSGTFQVPSSTEGDEEYQEEAEEDEIDFNDDDFTADDVETQDTAAGQEQAPASPLGKRSREDDEEDGEVGSDQELKRLKAG